MHLIYIYVFILYILYIYFFVVYLRMHKHKSSTSGPIKCHNQFPYLIEANTHLIQCYSQKEVIFEGKQ